MGRPVLDNLLHPWQTHPLSLLHSVAPLADSNPGVFRFAERAVFDSFNFARVVNFEQHLLVPDVGSL